MNERPPFDLDVRAYSHPEPLERVLAAMERLDEAVHSGIRMIHHREPFPLYEILRERGWRYETKQIEERLFHILISPPVDSAAAHLHESE